MFKTLFAMLVIAVLAGCEAVPRQVLPYVMDDESGAMDVKLFDLESGLSTTITQTPMTDEVDPVADHTGQRVAYIARQIHTGQAVFTVKIHDLESGQTQDAVRSTEPLFSPAWSNDGKRIAYVVQRDDKLQIDVIQLNANNKPHTIGFGSEPTWRVDDRAIFYNSRDTLDAPAGDLKVHTLTTGVNPSL
ncbi:MAG: TolB family protein, partial [Phycisphaeraceae bacterium]